MRVLEKALAVLVCIMMILLLAGMALRDPAGANAGPELSALAWEAASVIGADGVLTAPAASTARASAATTLPQAATSPSETAR